MEENIIIRISETNQREEWIIINKYIYIYIYIYIIFNFIYKKKKKRDNSKSI